jgi:hypothetical protein
MLVTLNPKVLNKRPVDDAITPLPIPDITPPETTIYLHFVSFAIGKK